MNANETLYRITTLAELQEMIDDVLANARATAGRKVHPEEIIVQTEEWKFVEANAITEKLSDGSLVFNLQF